MVASKAVKLAMQKIGRSLSTPPAQPSSEKLKADSSQADAVKKLEHGLELLHSKMDAHIKETKTSEKKQVPSRLGRIWSVCALCDVLELT